MESLIQLKNQEIVVAMDKSSSLYSGDNYYLSILYSKLVLIAGSIVILGVVGYAAFEYFGM